MYFLDKLLIHKLYKIVIKTVDVDLKQISFSFFLFADYCMLVNTYFFEVLVLMINVAPMYY